MSIMNINKLVFRNFKTLENVSFEPGRVNVFIGANGSGIMFALANLILADRPCLAA